MLFDFWFICELFSTYRKAYMRAIIGSTFIAEWNSFYDANDHDLLQIIILQHHSSALIKFLHNDRGFKRFIIFGVEP